MLGNIVYFIITLGILVAFHEWGHFWVARRCGVHVQRFSVGFGKPLFTRTDRLGTEYVVAGIPLGGYVKMLDTRNEAVAPADLPKTFNAKSGWQRAAIVAAGPIANFLLAALIYTLVFILGVPGFAPRLGEIAPGSAADLAGMRAGEVIETVDGQPVVSLEDAYNALLKRIGDSGTITIETRVLPDGFDEYVAESSTRRESGDADLASLLSAQPQQRYQLSIERWLSGDDSPNLFDSLGLSRWQPDIPAVIGQVVDDSPAQQAGLLAGDRLLSVDGREVTDFQAFAELVRPRPEEWISVSVYRVEGSGARNVDLEVKTAGVDESGKRIGQIGVIPEPVHYPDWMQITQRTGFMAAWAKGANEMVEKIEFTFDSLVKMVQGLISPRNLSGPLTIAQVAGSTAESGLVTYLKFLALLSVSLGVINLLPIPMLDGGQLVFIAAESAMGKPVPMSIQLGLQQVGLLAIFSLMAFALYNDFSRLL